MSSLLVALAQAKPTGPGGSFYIMLVVMGLAFWFMIIRPQSRQRRQHQHMLATLQSGDQVMTSGGIHGRITNVKDNTVIVKIADNVKIGQSNVIGSNAVIFSNTEDNSVFSPSETKKSKVPSDRLRGF